MSERRERRPLEKRALVIACATWAAAVIAGMGLLYDYAYTPGTAAPVADWPESSTLARDEARPTLLMVAHPRCSCSRASIGELARLMAKLRDGVRAYVLFVRPEGVDDGWERTDLYESALLVPDTRVVVDPGGVEAARFGAVTSGQAYLYAPSGELLFEGGITPARAHMGDSAGRERILALVRGEEADRRDSPVFGCSIDEDEPVALTGRATREPTGDIGP